MKKLFLILNFSFLVFSFSFSQNIAVDTLEANRLMLRVYEHINKGEIDSIDNDYIKAIQKISYHLQFRNKWQIRTIELLQKTFEKFA